MKIKLLSLTLLVLCITLLCFTYEPDKVTIYSIGDSTMCDYPPSYLAKFGGDNYPQRGWMQMMPQFFNDKVIIHNAARSGRSSKSFRDEGLWKPVIDKVKPGDYVFIMFGGNDQKTDSARHSDPRTTYKQNMLAYVNEVKAKGAYPVLFTSLVRRRFDKTGKMVDTYGDYVPTIRDLAKETNTPMVDLYKKTWDMVQSYGPEGSKKLFLYVDAGKFTVLPQGKQDYSHLCILGATKVAELAAEGLKEIKSPLAAYLK